MPPFSFRLFPGRCVLCGSNSACARDLCSGCEQDLPHITNACVRCALPLPTSGICGECLHTPPLFSRALVPFCYAAPLDALIKRFKYGADLASGRVLGQLFCNYLCAVRARQSRAANGLPPTCVIPMPLHPGRRWSRGFNQSVELARVIAGEFDLPCQTRGVRRVINTPAQQYLSRRQRRHNVRNAFATTADFSGQHVAIVDDVITTGSTANSLARALLAAGAKEVEVWAIARATGKLRGARQ